VLLARRLARLVLRNEERRRRSTPELDRHLHMRAASARARLNQDAEASIKEVVCHAWTVGQTIQLPDDVCYGPVHWDGTKRFHEQAFPYYYFLAGLVRSQSCATICEIGTHYGGSCLSMLSGITDHQTANIVTIDVTDLNPALHAKPGVTKLVGDANDEAVLKKATLCFGDAPVDLLYVDADHRFASTITNLGLYCLLLRPRFVLIDDILLNDEMRTLWSAMSGVYGANAANCAEIVSQIRSPDVGFGLIRLR
jgi:Methyltransferase domain